jgi:8-oxo-dGTP pyrophosphatase MutT (NUDIX family)
MLWRIRAGRLEVLLAHQGGPFWAKKDLGHWTIPKGEVEPGEEFVAVARREFEEETGAQVPNNPLIDLGQITQKSGKLVLGWAAEGDLDPSAAVSNTFDWNGRRARASSGHSPRSTASNGSSRRGTPKAEGGTSSVPRSAAGGWPTARSRELFDHGRYSTTAARARESAPLRAPNLNPAVCFGMTSPRHWR